MVRQPYSVAVPSTRGRLHPRFLRKRGLWEKVEFSLQERRRGRKKPFLMVKKDGMILELLIKRTKNNTMNIVKTEIEGVLIIEPRLFRDSCGYFFEIFSEREFEEKVAPIQDYRCSSLSC